MNTSRSWSMAVGYVLAVSLPAAMSFAGDAAKPRPFGLANEAAGWRVSCAEDGRILALDVNRDGKWEQIDFRSDGHAGPRWYGRWGGNSHTVALKPVEGSTTKFTGHSGEVLFWLQYASIDDRLAIIAGVRNHGKRAFEPVKAGLKLGLDTYMATYPEWNRKLFPTLLRCEKTHFWGYAMSPGGRILGIASPDPIASWSLDYRHLRHRVYTLNLDLLNALPLPARHPWDNNALEPGEEKQWTVFLVPVGELAELKPKLAEACAAPMFELQRHTVERGESASFVVYSGEEVTVRVIPPSGRMRTISAVSEADGRYRYRYQPDEWPGVYRLTAAGTGGKRAEASICMRRPWSWYLKAARKEALKYPQKPSTHTESWYGLFSMLLARKHFPDAKLDARAEAVFGYVFPLIYDPEKLLPLTAANRIQNTAAMCSLLVDRYQCTGEVKDLERAAGLVEFLIRHQGSDGAYYNRKTHYTSVLYIAKSIMEVMEEEKKLAADGAIWQQRYRRHYKSVAAAVDDLARRKDNIQTEGELTFEDGMISCSATQLAMFALLQDDPKLRKKYTDAAAYLMRAHRCLDQLAVPDCRTNGATLRFWEAQYDVLCEKNMISSPHGWSAWRIYGLWYLYLLTGEEEWLRQATNALGSCVQLIDSDTGTLRWAFVVDPYVQANVFEKAPDRPGQGTRLERVFGEKYVGMISDWWRAPPGAATGGHWGQGGCCDNDVHEIFKCLEEVALGSACVVQRGDGRPVGYNCRVVPRGERLEVTPSEPCVTAVHVNLKSAWDVAVVFAGKPTVYTNVTGTRWLRNRP